MSHYFKPFTPNEIAAIRDPRINPLTAISVLFKSACEGVAQASLANQAVGYNFYPYQRDDFGFSLPLQELAAQTLSSDYRKFMGIFGGPNGSGKTTTADALLQNIPNPPLKLNADDVTARLLVTHSHRGQDDLNLQAAQEVDARVRTCISTNQSFFVETVLSSPKYRDDVLTAKAKGYCIVLAFFTTVSPDINVDRVKLRVLKGGHDVPEERTRARYEKSHDQFSWFASQADILCVIDNSVAGGPPALIAYGLPGLGNIHHAPGLNPKVDRVIGTLSANQTPSGLPYRIAPSPRPQFPAKTAA